MPRILSLDKMLQDLRGALAQETSQQGFAQGFQQGKVDAAAKEAAALKEATQGQAAGQAQSEAMAASKQPSAASHGPAHAHEAAHQPPPPAAPPLPSNYDEQAQAYFQTLADMDKAEQDDPVATEMRSREALRARSPGGVDLAALDEAYRGQGGSPTIPGAAPPPRGAPPPPGGYAAAAPGNSPSPVAGMSPQDLAALQAAASGQYDYANARPLGR